MTTAGFCNENAPATQNASYYDSNSSLPGYKFSVNVSLRIGQSQPNKNIFANLANHAMSKKVDSMIQKQALKVRKKRPRSQEHSIGLTMCVFSDDDYEDSAIFWNAI